MRVRDMTPKMCVRINAYAWAQYNFAHKSAIKTHSL